MRFQQAGGPVPGSAVSFLLTTEPLPVLRLLGGLFVGAGLQFTPLQL
jgi:hypothetical protein